MTGSPTLIACSHGTSSLAGRTAIRDIVDGARALLPDVRIVETFVDVQDPRVDEVVRDEIERGNTAVVVPLLLSAGYHTRVDIARAVAAAGERAFATRPLGTHPLVADLVVRRLTEAGATHADAVVLAAAGSSDPASARDAREVAEAVSARWGSPVVPAFAANAEPLLGAALADARTRAVRTVASSYVLAPGHFADVIEAAGFDAVTAPLGPDPILSTVVADRYRAGVAANALST